MLVTLILLFAQFIVVLLSGALLVFAFSTLPLPVPYLPSKRIAFDRALAELKLQPNDVFYDLGSGDGRVVWAAHALEPRAHCIGIEKRWGWHTVARYIWWRRGAPPQVEFRRGDFYTTSLDKATKVYVFLCTAVIAELEPRFARELKGATLVSSDFPLTHKQPERIVYLPSQTQDAVSRRLYVYQY